MNPVSLNFMIEKKEGHGEDALPLSVVKEDIYAVGVFDGMGGSGAAICKSEFGDGYTKAYIASRIICKAIANYIENAKSVDEINADGIRLTAKKRLEQEKHDYPARMSGLRSKLVRDYPTTLAVTTASINEDSSYTVVSYWAGDSRNYLWNQDGFYQISKDDLVTELDPLENLRNDGALSNCICADQNFVINFKKIYLTGKFIILSATDGCFNYFATPMHFQEVLLTGLKLAESKDEWEKFCKEEITAVTGDDISLSLLAIGFNDFDDLKNTFKDTNVLNIEEIKQAQDEINSLSREIEKKKITLEKFVQTGWNEYKTSYMRYFNAEESQAKEFDKLAQQVQNTNMPTKDSMSMVKTLNGEADDFQKGSVGDERLEHFSSEDEETNKSIEEKSEKHSSLDRKIDLDSSDGGKDSLAEAKDKSLKLTEIDNNRLREDNPIDIKNPEGLRDVVRYTETKSEENKSYELSNSTSLLKTKTFADIGDEESNKEGHRREEVVNPSSDTILKDLSRKGGFEDSLKSFQKKTEHNGF